MTPSRPPALAALALLATALAHPLAALAAEPSAAEGAVPSGWGIGIGAGVQTRPYRDSDTEARVLPILTYENRWVRVAGLGVDLKLGSTGPVSYALSARYAMNGYEADDAPILDGMAEREGGLWLGPSVTWRTGYADLSAEALGDVSGKSKGAQFRLTLDRTFQAGDFRLTPRIAAVWHDKKYNDYYYGVRAEEARLDRPRYEGTASTDLELGLRTNYALTRQHVLFFDASVTRFGEAIKDSPLVDTRHAAGVRAGYLYRF